MTLMTDEMSPMIRRILIFALLLGLGVPAVAQKHAGLDSQYNFDVPALTPAPKGYDPFYLSHYGRHGSRYAWQRDL